MMASERKGHLPQLDGLRGLAIAMVLWLHTATVFGDFPSGGIYSFYQHLGFSGVDLFFVLSGFLITGILLDTRGCRGYLVSFLSRRALRIWPLYYVVTGGIYLILGPLVLKGMLSNYRAWRDSWPWSVAFAMNLHLARTGDWLCGITDVTWSVCVEEQFYLVWPFAVLALGAKGLRWLLVCLLTVSVASRVWLVMSSVNPWFEAYLLPWARLDPILAGAFVAIDMRTARPILARARLPATLFLAVAFALVSLPGLLHGSSRVVGAFTCFALAYALMLCAALSGGNRLFDMALRSRGLRYLGKISYGVYLVHLIVGHSLALVLSRKIHDQRLLHCVGFACIVFFSVGIASVSWFILEQPLLGLKRFVPRPIKCGGKAKAPGELAAGAAPCQYEAPVSQ